MNLAIPRKYNIWIKQKLFFLFNITVQLKYRKNDYYHYVETRLDMTIYRKYMTVDFVEIYGNGQLD